MSGIRQQGVGFLNATTGWVGGYGFTSITTDGGMTWQSDPWGENVNSIVVLSEDLAFAAGKRAYRYAIPTGADSGSGRETQTLLEVLGNPIRSETVLIYRVPAPGHVRLSVVAPSGRELSCPVDTFHEVGSYRTRWAGENAGGRAVPSGVHFIKLAVGPRVVETTKVLISR